MSFPVPPSTTNLKLVMNTQDLSLMQERKLESAAELARTSEWAKEGKKLLTTDKAERNIEANIPITGSTIGKDYPDYNAEMVTIKGHDKARLAVLIRKGINYTNFQIHTPTFNLPPTEFTNSPTNIS